MFVKKIDKKDWWNHVISYLLSKNTFRCHFTDGRCQSCARNVSPCVSALKPSFDTIFNGIVIVGLLAKYWAIIPICPRNFFVIADILPVVLTIWILDSQIESNRSNDDLPSLCDYFFIQNFTSWLKKSANAQISKTIFTILWCFSEIISSGFKVVAVA